MEIVPNPLAVSSGNAVPVSTSSGPVNVVSMTRVYGNTNPSEFRWGSAILSQASKNRSPVIPPEFPVYFSMFPQQAYEPTVGNDVLLDSVLTQWGIPTNTANPGYVVIDLEYVFGVIGVRPLVASDYVDPRTDVDLHSHMLAAITRIKALRPNWKVGFYTAWMSVGLGKARSMAESTSQIPARTVQKSLNDKLGDLFLASDFVTPSFYDRGEYAAGLEKMNCTVRDIELANEMKRVRTKVGASCELYATVSPFVGQAQTGPAPTPSDPNAVLRPAQIVKDRGWDGVIWWGNCASNAEYDYMQKVIGRMQYAMKIARV